MADAILEPVDVEEPGYDEALAMSQGWLLADNDTYGIEIERFQDDPRERFKTDTEALAYVTSIANAGDAHAIRCLANVAANIEYSAQVTARTEEWDANAAYCGECGMTHLPGECKGYSFTTPDAFVRATYTPPAPLLKAQELYASDDIVIADTAEVDTREFGYWVEARVWVPKNG